MKMILMSACVVMLCSLCGGATVSSDPKQLTGGSGNRGPYDCPLCDSSVYSYCSNKLLHDACCCISPKDPSAPYQCNYADCSFLHANTCREHHLITRCCCNRFIRL